MSLIRWTPWWDPFEEFEKFTHQFVPAVDVYQKKDSVVVETAILNVDPEKVEISIDGDVLTIRGESEKKSEIDEKDYYRKEVHRGTFHRSVALPARVQAEKAEALYENGILRITVPKEAESKGRSIKVKVKEA